MGTTVVTDEERFSPLPKALRENNAELEAMFEEQRKNREAAQAQPDPEPEPELQPEPEPEPEPESQPEPSPEMVSRAELEKAEHKYIVLQEKYNKELPELYRQNNFLYQTVQTLQKEVEVLKTRPAEQPKPKISLRENPKIQALKAELSPEVFENLVGAMEETTETQRKVFSEENERLRGELKGEFTTTRVKDREEIFWDAVRGTHEDYDKLANNPNLQDFLSEPEGLSGFSRGDFFIDAYKKRDSKTYNRYLNAFKKEIGGPLPENKILGGGSLNPDKLKNKMGAPRSSGGSFGTPPPGTKAMTKEEAISEYEKISDEYNKGRWEGRERDYDKKEAALVKIINSG